MAIKDMRKKGGLKESFEETKSMMEEIFMEAKDILERNGFNVIDEDNYQSYLVESFSKMEESEFKKLRKKLFTENSLYLLKEEEIDSLQEEFEKDLDEGCAKGKKEFEGDNDGDEDDVKDKEDKGKEEEGKKEESKEKKSKKIQFLEKLVVGMGNIDRQDESKLNLDNLIK